MKDFYRAGMASLVFVISLAIAPYPAPGQSIPAGKPASLDIITTIPAGKGPFPVVVLAPGAGYDMRQPLLERLAKALVARNIAVVRFDWAYFTADPKKGAASPDLSREIGDMKTALAGARDNPKIDGQHIILAGKSQGSVVAYRLFHSDAGVRAALLLTPVCVRPQAGQAAPPWMADVYPDFAAETRPIALILGDNDPACSTHDAFALAASRPKSVRVAVVGGDHSFADNARAGAEQRNLDLAVANAVDAAEKWLSGSAGNAPAR